MSNFNANQAEDIINHTMPTAPLVVTLSLIINTCIDRNQISDVDRAIGRINLLRQDINPVDKVDMIEVCKLLLGETETGLVLEEQDIYRKMIQKIEAVDRWMRIVYPPITLPE